MTRVGFIFSFDPGWIGGINYFRNLFTALYELPDREIEVIIFTGLYAPDIYFNGLPAIKIVRSSLFDEGSFAWRLRHRVRYRLSSDFLLVWLLKKHGVSVLSHSGWLLGNTQIPTIDWIPDFQHIHLPEYFSLDEINARNNRHIDMCKYCSTIIVSSFDAQSDLSIFNQVGATKSEVLQFVVSTDEEGEKHPSAEELQAKFNFTGKYFILPNQFWKHKNHTVVIEALGQLVQEGKRVLVLATGSSEDYRHPEYFNRLMERAKELNVLDNFRHLGIVRKSDLDGLMRDALAIINPSFFEGWSTSVEEAKALGKNILLSDIPVHREQNPPLAKYFLPDDATLLSTILWEVWNKPKTNDKNTCENAREINGKRRIEFAKKYQEIVIRALRKR
jgi:glycosyltransferase involved in cell wall biosynthesis